MEMNIWTVAILVFIINLPFGYWRANVRKLSQQWFLAIHIPVPFVIGLRIFAGLGWRVYTFPFVVGAFFLGQLAGSVLLAWWKKWAKGEVGSCIVMNVLRELKAYGAPRGPSDV
jgi:cytochrome b561